MKRTGLFIGLLVLIIGVNSRQLVAQDSGNETIALLKKRSVVIRPLEEAMQAPAHIVDITSNSAHLSFVAKVPLACTVVFGTTTQFGRAATDLNMNGAAIIKHNPVLLNLEPATLYYYRLQGSAEDGTLYIGEIGTFRTLEKSDELILNLLSPVCGAQVIGLSSNFAGQPNNGTWGILNAFDGDPNTAWASNGDGDKAWFEVRLGQRSRITKIEFWSRSMSDKTSEIFEFTITTDSGKVYGPFKLPDAEQSHSFSVDFQASTLRFNVIASSGGNTGAREVAVYGETSMK